MEDSDEIARMLKRMGSTIDNIDHPIRRLKAVIARFEKIGTMELQRDWLYPKLAKIETESHNVNESIDQLTNRLADRLP